ncbi:hypothetical protein Pr1d_06480 [Bythopirellula goksoeyrii]|uniref:DUF1569 domain-containing protein n=2 Tax=Bythopirellula goksoeyrii TaxID=1400387 RepID=A0A5B9Q345_9BACT|nr:hypothetical protein Pr1d_06480 [Bythopirellula goksoeyrii]
MPVNTKTCLRRKIEYTSLDELVADAERLVAADAPTTGNWSKGQILDHVASVMEMTIDGFPMNVNWFVRFISRNVMFERFLKNGMPSGFKPSKSVAQKIMPKETDVLPALAHLRTAVERLKQLDHHVDHAFFGDLTADQARAINRRHAELHMSFIAES